MDKTIYSILKKLEDNGYPSYVVGGYVRDRLLGIKSFDIDITTKAKPKEVLELFNEYDVKVHDYGNVSFEIGDYNFDITTFRKDITYKNHRIPVKLLYIDSFEEDLKRRDFTINAICLNKENKLIDLYYGKRDIKKKIIKSIGDPHVRLEEDALRILRAIRFACTLKFKLDTNLKDAIIKNKSLLKELSYERKKEELNKIFSSKNKKYGIRLLKELDLLGILELKNIDYVFKTKDLIAMWSMITDQDYAFTKREKEIIKDINNLMPEDINNKFVQYKAGSYLLSAVSSLKGQNPKRIISSYDKLPIKDRNEIKITAEEICEVLNKKPDSFLKDIMIDLEKSILNNKLKNDKEVIKRYIQNKY